MNKDNASFDEKHFSAKFSNKDYYFELCLFNNLGQIVYLKKSTLISLIIEDNLFNPFHTANMIINDDSSLLEKSESSYSFLGNGRDILSIKIIPVLTGDFEKDINNPEIKKYMQLSYQFVVIESKQTLYNNMVCRQLDMVEFPQYALSESICNIFGIQKPTGTANYMNTNAGNSVPTGEAVKKILEEVFGHEDIYYFDEISKQIVFDMSGNDSLMISPYGLVSYMEVLCYVMAFHSHEESPCLLQYDRFEKKFQLISLKRLFSEHEQRVNEAINIPSQTKGNGNKPIINWNYVPTTFAESRVVKYYIDSPAAKYNINLSGQSGIMTNSRTTKSMVFDLQSLNSDNFTQKYYDLFVKPFEQTFSDYKLDVNFQLSPNNVDNYSTFQGNLPKALEEKKFLNQKLSTLLYLNGSTYQFSLEGLTHRQAMTFVDIIKNSDNPDKNNPTQWDYNHIGRHIVTCVKHIFQQDTYMNEIETIKPYVLRSKDDKKQSIKDFLTDPKSKAPEQAAQSQKTAPENINDKIKNAYNEMKSYRELGEKIQKEFDSKPAIQDAATKEAFYNNQKSKLNQLKTDFKKLLGNADMSDEEAQDKAKKLSNNPIYRTFPWGYLF